MSFTSWFCQTTKLAPRAFESQTIAIWFLADASSQAINDKLHASTPGTESAYFGIIAVAIVGGILLFTVKEPIKN